MQKILITEDDQFLANICREKFVEMGFDARVAHTGSEAIQSLSDFPVDVVLLDLMLPEIDGIGVLKFIRSNESLRHLPVIILSNSKCFSGIGLSALEEGATGFLNKGDFPPHALVAQVEEILLANQAKKMPRPVDEPPPIPPRAFIKPAVGPIRVIVADDEQLVQNILGFYMEQAGYQVRSAFNGRRALEMADDDPPDIMVLDGMMPQLDGYSVLRLWQKHPKLATIPVIMLTANPEQDCRRDAVATGAVEFLAKPFCPSEIINLINSYVGKR